MSSGTTVKVAAPVKFTERKLSDNGKLIITRELQDQINYLHKKVGNIEWSGILLYKKLGGDIDEPKEFIVKADHIFLMDIGSHSYTEAEINSEDVLDVYDMYPQTDGWKQGLIHTHHNMATFFSGTDQDEMQINTQNHNYYLSLIVNFDGKYSARIGYMADMTTKTEYAYKNSEDKKKKASGATTEKVLVYFDLTIEREVENIVVPETFLKRMETIKERKEVQKVEAARKSTFYPFHTGTAMDRTPSVGEVRNYSASGKSTWNAKTQQWEKSKVAEELETSGGKSQEKKSFPGNQKSKSSREPHSIPLIGDREARELTLEWINEGLQMDTGLETQDFVSVYSAIQFFETLFLRPSHRPLYGKFMNHMTNALFDVSIDYKPSIISHVLLNNLKYYRESSIAKDLMKIAEAHPAYCKALKKNTVYEEIDEVDTHTNKVAKANDLDDDVADWQDYPGFWDLNM